MIVKFTSLELTNIIIQHLQKMFPDKGIEGEITLSSYKNEAEFEITETSKEGALEKTE